MRFSLILPIAAAGSVSLVAASHAQTGAHNAGFELAKRHFDVSVHQNDRRTLCLLEGILSGIFGGSSSCGSNYPSPTWKCSGSGLDGYQYDQYKNRCPSKYPAGWLWFGADKGWGPPKGWSVPSKTWVPPSDFGSKCSIFTWWAPSSTWQYSLSFPVPSFWLNLGWNSYLGPSQSWTCNKSGLDGWDYDYAGKPCPYNNGFKWFGSSIGWAPAAGWQVPSLTWNPIAEIKWSLISWWKPSTSWICPPTFTPPSFWPTKPTTTTAPPPPPSTTAAPPAPTHNPDWPSKDWYGRGDGNDGRDVDWEGKRCPYVGDKLFDSNGAFKWFGIKYGWQPEESWNIPYPDWKPPSGWTDVECAKATWWVPASSWKYPIQWVVPSFWKLLDPSWKSVYDTAPTQPTQPNWPAKDWTCDGSGYDGKDFDFEGKTCPYVADKLFDSNGKWKWFGISIGWQPEESWNIPYPDWKPPSGWTDVECAKATWWVPASSWKYPIQWSVPTFWKSLDPSWKSVYDIAPTQPNWPAKDWQCSGNGDDGKDVDWQGNKCPLGLPFLWFGTNIGWAPAKGWRSDDNWTPYSGFASSCQKWTWWAPHSAWKYPVGFSFPSFWFKLGFFPYNWAPSSFVCNGSGADGYSFDHLGNGLPSGFPSGWFYFGIANQWQPHKDWKLPSSTWVPPASWTPTRAPWWQPNTTWKVPNGYACPSWWPVNLIQTVLGGILGWIF